MRAILILVLTALLASALTLGRSQEPIVVFEGFRHLGDGRTDWEEATPWPTGVELEVEFEAPRVEGPVTLFLSQRSIDSTWRVSLNGDVVATLDRAGELVERGYQLPPGVLREGANRLRIDTDDTADDVTIGNVRIVRGTLRSLLDLREVTVRVRDGEGGEPIPARVTVLDASGAPALLRDAATIETAVRAGVCYTQTGTARFEVPAGNYRIVATRGMEWSRADRTLAVGEGPAELDLELVREVDTRGFVACDTHVHTLTFSGHGDSSVEERLVTLAGEGVELAIATDHNHNTDYRPLQVEMGLTGFFTPVVGNEVTTPIGHLNAFPLDPADEIPPYDLRDMDVIVAGIRARGARAVILNHPRWPSHADGPYGRSELDEHTGWSDMPHPYDAVELINSDTEESDPMQLFRDWFALLNRGERLTAVGSSDSHTVGVMVGGGRTYLASATDDPAAIDVEDAAASLVAGRSSIAMGIFSTVDVNGGSMGALVRPRDGRVEVKLRVAAPSWIRPRVASVFLNGTLVAELEVAKGEGATDATLTTSLESRWDADAWLVCVVQGDGVEGPGFPLRNGYTLSATNPVYVDGDGDGEYRSPRATARAWLEETGTEETAVTARLARAEGVTDGAVLVQYLDLVRAEWMRTVDRRLSGTVREAGLSSDPAERVGAWIDSLPASAQE